MICQVLSNLTNLSLNDQLNMKIRLVGAHYIGIILMENCPVLIKEKQAREQKLKQEEKVITYSDDSNEDTKIKHEI